MAWTSGIFSGVMAPARALNLFSVWIIQSEGHGRNDNTYLKAYLPLRSLSPRLALPLLSSPAIAATQLSHAHYRRYWVLPFCALTFLQTACPSLSFSLCLLSIYSTAYLHFLSLYNIMEDKNEDKNRLLPGAGEKGNRCINKQLLLIT